MFLMEILLPKRGYSARRCAGATDMVLIGIVLPTLILLIAGVVDLARVPIARDRLHKALSLGAYGAEQFVVSQGDNQLIDMFTPAGNNLCEDIYPPGDCESGNLGTGSGFFSLEVSKGIAQGACELARRILREDASGIFNYDIDQDGGLQFAVARMPVDPLNGRQADSMEIIYTSNACGTSFSTVKSGGVDPSTVAAALLEKFKEAGAGAGAWYINDGVEVSSNEEWLSRRTPYLRSYWLVGAGHLEVKFIMGRFFGKSRTVVEYFIRPFGVPAGIQKGR